MVPLTCGKLQAWRGLGAVLCAGAACVAAAQGPARASPDVLVSSALERIGSPLSADPAAADGAADALIVSVRFTNASAQVVDSIRVTSEVPPGLQYVAGSASAPGSEALFSIDGAQSFGRPDELTVEGPDGEVRPAEPAEYTHVRFILHAPLDAGATGIARFRAVPR